MPTVLTDIWLAEGSSGIDAAREMHARHVDFTYQLPFAFTGKIEHMTIELGKMQVSPAKTTQAA
jgi:hypothetical protein